MIQSHLWQCWTCSRAESIFRKVLLLVSGWLGSWPDVVTGSKKQDRAVENIEWLLQAGRAKHGELRAKHGELRAKHGELRAKHGELWA